MIYTSHSKSELDQRCPRERFYGRIFGGHGIEPVGGSIELALGQAIHQADALETATPEEAATVAGAFMKDWCKTNLVQSPVNVEYPILAEALVFGYRKRVLPEILKMGGRILYSEQEVRFQQGDITWRAIPDRLFQLGDGTVWYQEKKTTSLDPQTFSRIWERKTQLHVGALAVKETLGLDVEGVVVQGFYKGTRYRGNLRSRLVGGYRRDGVPGVTKPTYKADYAKGFEWFLASEYPGGVTEWVRQLPREIIAEAFPVTQPITPNPRLLIHYLHQRNTRELAIQKFKDELDALAELISLGAHELGPSVDNLIDEVFPQNLDSCENPITHFRCQFYNVCWDSVVGHDPIGSGLYKKRAWEEPQPLKIFKKDEV